MDEDIIKRAIAEGEYIAETGSTVRAAAKVFSCGKSTVHKDVTERLCGIDKQLYKKVKKVLNINLAERHIRGGEATRRKYEKKDENA